MSSCETLRKKFIRQKKKDLSESAELAPVLEPQEYPAPENNPLENYKQHYALVKVWYGDLVSGVIEKDTDQKVKYALAQVNSHLDQMAGMIKKEKQSDVKKLKDLLVYYKAAIDLPNAVRNRAKIQSDLRTFDRELRHDWRPDVIKKDLLKVNAT